jgi:hypothetical protein
MAESCSPSRPSYAEQLQKALTQVTESADIGSHASIPVYAGKIDAVQEGAGSKKRTQARVSGDTKGEVPSRKRTHQALSRTDFRAGDGADSAGESANRNNAPRRHLKHTEADDQVEYEESGAPSAAVSSYAQLLSMSMSESGPAFRNVYTTVLGGDDEEQYETSGMEGGGSAVFGPCALDVLASVADSELKHNGKRGLRIKGRKKSR